MNDNRYYWSHEGQQILEPLEQQILEPLPEPHATTDTGATAGATSDNKY